MRASNFADRFDAFFKSLRDTSAEPPRAHAPTIAETIAAARQYLYDTRTTQPRAHDLAVAVAALADELHDTAHMLATALEEQRNALHNAGVLLGAVKLRAGGGQ